MKPIKLILRLAATLALLFFTITLLQAGLFYFILTIDEPSEKADLIVAFEGRRERAQSGYELAEQNFAPVLAISPATHRQLRAYDQKYRPKNRINKIVEEKARTTFENALYTQKIVKENGFKSLILVTSWDHMPRSYILFKMMLFGTGTQIHPYAVATKRLHRKNWHHYTVGWKMVYNEMVKCWGSFIEFVQYRIVGRLPAIQPGKAGFLNGLKKYLLFKIDSEIIVNLNVRSCFDESP